MSDLPIHPRTGLRAIGIGKRGPIWPIAGGSQPLGAPPTDPPADDPNPPTDPPTTEAPDRGFPENTPIVEMSAEQRANYFKFHDRRKSDTLKAYQGITPEQALEWKQQAEAAAREQQTPSERALEDARSEAAAAALNQAATEWAPLLAAEIVGQFVPEEDKRSAVLAGINPMTFVKDGKFDKDGLIGHLTGLATAFGGASQEHQPRQWGQSGDRPPAPSASEAGLAEARRRGFIKD